MGTCFSCFKEPPPPNGTNQSTVLEHKDETMELRTLFSQNDIQNHPHTNIESHVNGNKNSSLSMSTFNGVGSDNCGSVPTMQTKLRRPHGFYSQLPSTNAGVNSTTGSKQLKEPLDSKINALFEVYKDPEEDRILEKGIEQLCKDLQLAPEEFKVLVLAWKLNAEKMCQFTRQEFVGGLKAMKVDTIAGILRALPKIIEELTRNDELFKDLYRFTFRFGLDVSTGQRILPVDTAIQLWRLVFTIREPPLLARWLKFLECHHIRGIPRDTWNMFLNFVESIGDDLGAYDDAEAWPSLFDDFVEYEKDEVNQNIKKRQNEIINDLSTEND